ncbi:acyl-CoA dehydrogenase family protein [Povalibacter sp.]|uniref:acyl-CoA dehydrogenase family protein n=1 Tax=Povalibacter sp. TaxID=1962978 RepID=UPI002F3E9230
MATLHDGETASSLSPTDKEYELTAERAGILETADRFARRELAPLFAKMDADEWWPPYIMRSIGSAGLIGVAVDPEFGGAGLDFFCQGLVIQAFARHNSSIGLSYAGHENLFINNLDQNGTPQQRAKYLPGCITGDLIGALGMTEPGAGSDAIGSMATVAHRDGDSYILNGRKTFITNGPIADVMIIYAKTAPERGTKGVSAFLVEKNFPGFSVAQKLIKMGHRGSPTGELVFDNCRVPAENLLGEENKGVAIMMSGLDLERAIVGSHALGVAERALEITVEYAKQRVQFGKPIASFQMVQALLADMYVAVESMRQMVYYTLAKCNRLAGTDGGRGEIHKLTAATVLLCGRSLQKICDSAVQVHGGMGYMWETEVNRLYRAAKVFEIGAGTNEIRRLIIAGELLSE